MKKLIAVIVAALALAGAAFPASLAVWDGKMPKGCVRLLPKGGGTVVNGTFVSLNQGQVLLMCNTAFENRTPPPPPESQ